MSTTSGGTVAQKAATSVLLTLCAAQFLMALYTLVMAMLMVTGGKIGSIIGRKRVFMIGASSIVPAR